MDEPLRTSLIQTLGDFGQRHSRCGTCCSSQTSLELLDQRFQRGGLRPILQTSFLSLAVGLGGIAIVRHFELTGSRSNGRKIMPRIGPSVPAEGAGF